MITVRCTRKVLALLGGATVDSVPEPTAALGDWYANVVRTVAGDLVVLANERTLLSVAIPVEMVDRLVPCFADRVYNLLRMIDVPTDVALRECAELHSLAFAPTSSRSVIGSLNEIGWHYQLIAEGNAVRGELSLSAIERQLSRMMHKPLGYAYPAEVATQILQDRYGFAPSGIARPGSRTGLRPEQLRNVRAKARDWCARYVESRCDPSACRRAFRGRGRDLDRRERCHDSRCHDTSHGTETVLELALPSGECEPTPRLLPERKQPSISQRTRHGLNLLRGMRDCRTPSPEQCASLAAC